MALWERSESDVTEIDDSGAEFFGFGIVHAGDGLQLCEGAGTLQHNAAQRGGSEDEELRKTDAFGFGFAPGTKLGVEEKLVGSEIGGGVGGVRTDAVKFSWGALIGCTFSARRFFYV